MRISKLINDLLTKQRRLGDVDVLVRLPGEPIEPGCADGWEISRIAVYGNNKTTQPTYAEDAGKVVLILE